MTLQKPEKLHRTHKSTLELKGFILYVHLSLTKLYIWPFKSPRSDGLLSPTSTVCSCGGDSFLPATGSALDMAPCKGNDSTCKECSSVGGSHSFQRGWIYCRLPQSTPQLWTPGHTSSCWLQELLLIPTAEEQFQASIFPCVHVLRAAPNSDKSWTEGPRLFEMPFSPSAQLQQEINVFEWFLYTVGSNRLERTDWFLQPSPHSLGYRTSTYSGAIAIWVLCQMEWSINLIF